jgi:hypothetical protein
LAVDDGTAAAKELAENSSVNSRLLMIDPRASEFVPEIGKKFRANHRKSEGDVRER